MFGFKKLADKWDVLELNQNAKYTPDLCKLEAFKQLRLFVPDNLQRRFDKHSLLGESKFEAMAFTSDHFHFWKRNLLVDSFPIPLEAPKDERVIPSNHLFPNSAKILGELHLITPDVMVELDNLRQNGVQFVRRRVHVLVPNRLVRATGYHKYEKPHWDDRLNGPVVTDPERVDIQKAWMYIGVKEYWDPLIDAGYSFSAVNQFSAKNRPWLKRYFQFTNYEKPK